MKKLLFFFFVLMIAACNQDLAPEEIMEKLPGQYNITVDRKRTDPAAPLFNAKRVAMNFEAGGEMALNVVLDTSSFTEYLRWEVKENILTLVHTFDKPETYLVKQTKTGWEFEGLTPKQTLIVNRGAAPQQTETHEHAQ